MFFPTVSGEIRLLLIHPDVKRSSLSASNHASLSFSFFLAFPSFYHLRFYSSMSGVEVWKEINEEGSLL